MDASPPPRRPLAALRRRPFSVLRDVLVGGAGGGVILMIAAAAALAIANSAAAPAYFGALAAHAGPLTVAEWINDGLMAVFFLLVGLEIKREALDGGLATWPRRLLPGAAAVGGMLVPAAAYVAVALGHPDARPGTLRGWAIPSATDIAFVLGVLALLGPRVPVSLKVFLTALAIIDDLGAIVVIALFYAADLNGPALAGAGLVLAALAGLNRWGATRLLPYLGLGLLLWFLVLRSGIHPTLAGVALAMAIPLRPSPGRPDDRRSPLHALEHALEPGVAYGIVPLFGFANAGVRFADIAPADVLAPVTLGVAAGLFLGKQAGVFLVVRGLAALGWAERPEGATWPQVYGAALLCGVGFTMSLFIGLLAFPGETLRDEVKVGVLAGSTLSGLAGSLVLALAARRRARGRASAA